MASSDIIHVSPAKADAFAKSVLTRSSVSEAHASLISTALVLADPRGVDTHGLNRLAGYLERVKHGVLDPAPSPPLSFNMKTPVMAHLDAKNTFGFVAGAMAIDKGVEIAETFGIGVVAVKNSNHFGMGATYLLRAVEKGYAAMAFTNASRSMPPWGSKEALLGTSPFAVGLPGGSGSESTDDHFILDMSPSVAARGKIRKAERRAEKIPEGYALDDEGRPTTDPTAALRGVVLPIGGPKGSGLAMMMDIFGGVLTGANFAGGVNDQYKNLKEPQGVGHWFIIFKPDLFLDSREEYESRMRTLFETVRGCEKAAGFDRIYVSGEIERDQERKRREEGIPYTRGEVEALHELAEGVGSEAKLV